MIKRSILFLIFMMMVSSCSTVGLRKPTPDLKTVRFMAGYKPQANLPFVGVYVAQEKGFFEEEGIDVEITHSTGKGEHVQYLVAGEIDVTTADAANVIQRRVVSGVPIVSFALIGQTGQQAFATLSDSGINNYSDWRGKTIGFKGSPTFDLLALLQENGYDESEVHLVNVGFDPRVLVEGIVDIYPVYKSNEPFLLSNLGFEVDLWDPAASGIETMGLAYVTSDEKLENDPELLRRFLIASLRGIEFAAANPEEAVDIVMSYCDPETDRDLMVYMLTTELKDATSPNGFGYQNLERWRILQTELLDHGVITELVPIEKIVDTSIWETTR